MSLTEQGPCLCSYKAKITERYRVERERKFRRGVWISPSAVGRENHSDASGVWCLLNAKESSVLYRHYIHKRLTLPVVLCMIKQASIASIWSFHEEWVCIFRWNCLIRGVFWDMCHCYFCKPLTLRVKTYFMQGLIYRLKALQVHGSVVHTCNAFLSRGVNFYSFHFKCSF